MAGQAFQNGVAGDFVVDMDQIARSAIATGSKPAFYYAEKSQQHLFRCSACGLELDILGRYGYCSSCSTHNGRSELEADLVRIRTSLSNGGSPESCVKDGVSAFDSMAGKVVSQLLTMVPMSTARKRHWEKRLFHNLEQVQKDLLAHFDINLFLGFSPDDQAFAKLMFFRRHVYEHKGGEADERYIQDSGDSAVVVKQLLRETSATAGRLVGLLSKLAENLLAGFHDIVPPEEKALPSSAKKV